MSKTTNLNKDDGYDKKQIGKSPEVRAHAVRMVFEHQVLYETQAGAIAAIAPKIGRIPLTLREWVSDFTYVFMQGFVNIAFVTDTVADRIVGWRVSRSAKIDPRHGLEAGAAWTVCCIEPRPAKALAGVRC